AGNAAPLTCGVREASRSKLSVAPMTSLSLLAPVRPGAGAPLAPAAPSGTSTRATNILMSGGLLGRRSVPCRAVTARQPPRATLVAPPGRSAAPRQRPVPRLGNAAPQLGQHYCLM